MKRPFVFSNMAMTADGKITSARREHPKFASTTDRRTMDLLRARADAVMVGAGTLRADDPPMVVRDAEARAARQALGKPPGIANVIVSGKADVPRGSRLFAEDGPSAVVIATTDGAATHHLEGLPRLRIVRCGATSVDLPRLLGRLHDDGIEHLLVEGGGTLNFSLLEHGLIDEMHVTIAPAILGGATAPTWVDGPGFAMAEQRRLTLVEAKVVGDEIFCHWRASAAS